MPKRPKSYFQENGFIEFSDFLFEVKSPLIMEFDVALFVRKNVA